MTVTIVFADSGDGFIRSEDDVYADALAGSSRVADDTGGSGIVGQSGDFGQGYAVWQTFLDFDGSAVAADQLAVTGYVRMRNTNVTGTSVDRDAELRKFDWGASLAASDWRTPAQLGSATLETRVRNSHNMLNGAYVRFAQETGVDPDQIYVICSSRNRLQQTPADDEYNTFTMSEGSGTSSDPALYYTTMPRSTLDKTLGAQAQLSDGTHVLIEADVSPDEDYRLRHHDGTSATTKDSQVGSDLDDAVGAQSLAICVDDDDNIFFFRASPGSPNTVRCRAYIKQAGHNWTAGTFTSFNLPAHDGTVNNLVAAWHNEGSGGTIMLVASRTNARNAGQEVVYALVNGNHLLSDSGSILRASGDVRDINLVYQVAANGFNGSRNETGTLLDVAAAPDTTNRGFVVCTTLDKELGDTASAGVSVGRYQLAAGGASVADGNNAGELGSDDEATKDAAAKARMIGISTSQFVSVVADPDMGDGVTVTHRQNFGTSGTFNVLSRTELDAESLSTMPSASTLATSQAWDAVYYPLGNKVYVYYFDTGDGRRLMRTGVDLSTGAADGAEVEVNSTVGASGSTNHAIRVHRGVMTGDQVLISVANETSGGAYSTIYVVDELNVAPTAPTLTMKTNFDATNEATFEWTFNDPNSTDTQSAFQLVINDSGGASAWNTGKAVSGASNYTLPASSLSNPGDWQWQVRTWDNHDAVGPYSTLGAFSTSASGTVTITDPATDNPAGVNTDDYTIEWMVSGTTQDDYRVVVVRTDTSAELVNTGWVNSTDTTFEVTGMLSDVEYEVQVTVRNSDDVETNTDTVLITPDYASPEQPTVAVSINNDGGYLLVEVSNPSPTGDRPSVDHNDILRRLASSTGAYVKIGECGSNASFRDYTAASGIEYTYVARARSEAT